MRGALPSLFQKYGVVLQYRKIFNFNNNILASTVTRLQTERPDNRSSIPEKNRLFLQYRVETGTGAKAAPYAMKPESLFL
jgi:hypothetical protein